MHSLPGPHSQATTFFFSFYHNIFKTGKSENLVRFLYFFNVSQESLVRMEKYKSVKIYIYLNARFKSSNSIRGKPLVRLEIFSFNRYKLIHIRDLFSKTDWSICPTSGVGAEDSGTTSSTFVRIDFRFKI